MIDMLIGYRLMAQAQKTSPPISEKSVSTSRTGSKTEQSSWSLSIFRANWCNGTDSAFKVKVWSISEKTMRDLIIMKLCNGIAAVADNLIDVCDEALRKLRCMFAWLDHEQVFIDEENHFHPVFILFLKYVVKNLPDTSKAQNIQVCGEVYLKGVVQKKGNERRRKKGFGWLYRHRSNSRARSSS